MQTNKLQKRGVRVNHLRVDALLLSQEDFDTYLESTLLAERRVGIKYAQRGVEERLLGKYLYIKQHDKAC